MIVHHVTHLPPLVALTVLSCSPSAMTYLALPLHYLTPPRSPVKATGQVSLKSYRGLGRAVLCKNFLKTQLFSVINHMA